MKKFIVVLFFSAAFAGIAGALTNNVLTYFSGRQEGEAISVEWRSGVEAGIKEYVVERTTSRTEDYKSVGTVKAQGNYASYRYRDTKPMIMMASDAENPTPSQATTDLFKYRLKMVYQKEISYSQAISVTKPSSGVKRTWGMIKEMFH